MIDSIFLEQLKTVRNLVDIAVILFNIGREDLLPTVLELMQVEIQEVVLSYCVVDEQN